MMRHVKFKVCQEPYIVKNVYCVVIKVSCVYYFNFTFVDFPLELQFERPVNLKFWSIRYVMIIKDIFLYYV